MPLREKQVRERSPSGEVILLDTKTPAIGRLRIRDRATAAIAVAEIEPAVRVGRRVIENSAQVMLGLSLFTPAHGDRCGEGMNGRLARRTRKRLRAVLPCEVEPPLRQSLLTSGEERL